MAGAGSCKGLDTEVMPRKGTSDREDHKPAQGAVWATAGVRTPKGRKLGSKYLPPVAKISVGLPEYAFGGSVSFTTSGEGTSILEEGQDLPRVLGSRHRRDVGANGRLHGNGHDQTEFAARGRSRRERDADNTIAKTIAPLIKFKYLKCKFKFIGPNGRNKHIHIPQRSGDGVVSNYESPLPRSDLSPTHFHLKWTSRMDPKVRTPLIF